MNLRYLVAASLYIISLSTTALLQVIDVDKHAEADRSFDEAAVKHKRELEDLLKLRGASLVGIRDVTSTSIARVLKARTKGPNSEAGYLENTAVLFYSYEETDLNIWLVDQTGVKASSKLPIQQQEIAAAISNLRSSIKVDSFQLSRTPRQLRSDIVLIDEPPRISHKEAIKNLTDILIPSSIATQLDAVKHLIIVPSLGIGSVPFAVLRPLKKPTSYLIDRMSVTIAPSLFDLGQNIESWDANFSSPLIVGNPYLPPNAKWHVPTLPGAQAEAQVVAKMLNAKPILGKEATKQEILSRASDADFLYFASHGVADSTDPLARGFLMLSAPEFVEGWWTAKEIQGADLKGTKLAVLSACQTGLGKVHDAGIIGLGRAFQIAGVPRVVMSLWSVDDAATNRLMQAFMTNIRGPEEAIPSEALRRAMIQVKRKRPNPSEWASFVVFGTPR